MVRPIAKKIMKGDVSIKDISTTTRLQKRLPEYSDTAGGAVKAARYYNEHIAQRNHFGHGDSVNWVYVSKSKDGLPYTPVVAYEDISELDGFIVDYDLMVDKIVKDKIKPIFKALDWDLERASGAAMPKVYW